MTISRKRRGTSRQKARQNDSLPPKQRFTHRQDGNNLQVKASSVEQVKQDIPSISHTHSSNQQEGKKHDSELASAFFRPPSRQIALRGALSLPSRAWEDDKIVTTVVTSPRLNPLPFARTFRASSLAASESIEVIERNAARSRTSHTTQQRGETLARTFKHPCTLSRYQTLDNLPKTVRTAASFPTSYSTGSLPNPTLSRRQALQSAVVQIIETAIPQAQLDGNTDSDDETTFFITELEAAARLASGAIAQKRHNVARHVTLGSVLLYGTLPAFVAAIRHFTAALELIQDPTFSLSTVASSTITLASLLYHHQGVALRELVLASISSSSKLALACTKHAFEAQKRALQLAKRGHDTRLQARAVKALGLLLFDARAFGPARLHQEEALALALQAKDRELEARIYANLGNLALAQRHFSHALSCHQRDLELCSAEVLDCRLGRARAHRNLSIVYAKLQRREEQLQHEQAAFQAAYSDGGAYLHDMIKHRDKSMGNICFQSSSDIEPALVTFVTQHLADVASTLGSHRDGWNDDLSGAALELESRTGQGDMKAAVVILGESKSRTTKNIRETLF